MASTNTFKNVTLHKNDASGAKLKHEMIEDHRNTELKLWLECSSLKTGWTKPDLVQM